MEDSQSRRQDSQDDQAAAKVHEPKENFRYPDAQFDPLLSVSQSPQPVA
jgi:hypothetical protein